MGGVNIGELSEFYAALRILGEGVLHGADEHLNPQENEFLRILRVVRRDFTAFTGPRIFFIGGKGVHAVPKEVVLGHAGRLFESLAAAKGGRGRLSPEETEAFMNLVGCEKAAASSDTKRDITLAVFDNHTGGNAEYGFSIKSYVGGDPTLLNASGATNLSYRVTGLSGEDARAFAAIDKASSPSWVRDRLALLRDRAAAIRFDHYDNRQFESNLLLIDDALPRIVADVLQAYYFQEEPEASCHAVVEDAARRNPRNYPDPERFYKVKFQRFLRSVALGMKPSEAWDDSDDATGGYIIVRPDGKIVAFYIYNRKLFNEYLLNCTRFERASASRHHYMDLAPAGPAGEYFLTLNLQIRFRKPCGM